EVKLQVPPQRQAEVERIASLLRALRDLRWRYTEGPGGRGRAPLGMTNATGCSSVWGSTYPFNPYPFPWVNHLFQDAPSVAIGIFEGHMRKMADGFAAIRRAQAVLDGSYDPERDEEFLARFDWTQFSDEEFALCPPVIAMGGDGAMLDIGFQNLSRLLASGKPVRVVVLDTQVYSNTGGQACTSGFTGQVSDMAAFGAAQHGKTETRKELALLALAHRNVFVHQSSQANPSHLLAGVFRGLQQRLPAVFVLHCPCPPEHGLGDDAAMRAARLALESRAFPLLTYDPGAGDSLAERISLDGNPMVDQAWPSYDLKYVGDDGADATLSLPLTVADWAATEARFKQHFKPVPPDVSDDDVLPYHEYLALSPEERDGKLPFIWALTRERKLRRMAVSDEIVALGRDRLALWDELRELAGVKPAAVVRSDLERAFEAEFEAKLRSLRAEYEAKLADLRAQYPRAVARQLAQGLMKLDPAQTIGDLLRQAQSRSTSGSGAPARLPALDLGAVALGSPSGGGDGDAVAAAAHPVPAAAPAASATATAVAEPEAGVEIEPYIETARCTSCDECTRLNSRLFAYNDKKQAYIKDPHGGTFRELVQAAEKCPVGIIHPGTPLDPKERDLEKWVKRAAKFN
ncbi:MAG TPA: ferredoxin, partial [Gemmatimonadales bacterium]|nr:ferredoxin [Gemmatimonadales bacterium]